MKIFFILILIGTFCYIGYSIMSYFKNRKSFFNDLVSFCKSYISEIKFSKENISKIIEKFYTSYKMPFKNFLLHYNQNKLIMKSNFLNNHELCEIKNFFDQLGSKDINGELLHINNYLTTFEKFSQSASQDLDKKGKLYFKLILILGALLLLIIV